MDYVLVGSAGNVRVEYLVNQGKRTVSVRDAPDVQIWMLRKSKTIREFDPLPAVQRAWELRTEKELRRMQRQRGVLTGARIRKETVL